MESGIAASSTQSSIGLPRGPRKMPKKFRLVGSIRMDTAVAYLTGHMLWSCSIACCFFQWLLEWWTVCSGLDFSVCLVAKNLLLSTTGFLGWNITFFFDIFLALLWLLWIGGRDEAFLSTSETGGFFILRSPIKLTLVVTRPVALLLVTNGSLDDS